MKEKHIIVAVHITDRIKHVGPLQETFTKYGCLIKTRIGLHEASENFCSPNGIIILELLGNEEKAKEMEADLNKIEGIEIKSIIFDHQAENML